MITCLVRLFKVYSIIRMGLFIMEFETHLIHVRDLELDFDNPRFCHLTLSGRKLKTQIELENEILKDDEIKALLKSIKKSGVTDPIWVKKRDNGKYIVLEGNRRTAILKKLLKEEVEPPEDVSYEKVKANIIDPKTSKQDELLQKARLQTGKKVWGAFNEAAITYMLRQEHLMEFEDISIELQISISAAKKRIENYMLFNEYVKYTHDENPRKFAFFTDSPAKVRSWFLESDQNLKTYFKLITPKEGVQKIRSVSTKGGLRDFAKVVDSPPAIKYLIQDPSATVESALDIAKENDITKDIPFITKFGSLASQLMGLTESQIENLDKNLKYKLTVKQMRKACDYILKQMG